MAKMYYDADADLSLIQGKKVAVIGYGSQGHAHSLNLKDSGVQRQGRVCRPTAGRARRRRRRGSRSATSPTSRSGPTSSWCWCRTRRPRSCYKDAIEPNLAPGKMLMFAHGFNIRFGTITVRPDVDVVDGRAEVAGPPRSRAVRRGRRHAGADRRSIRTRPATRKALTLSYAKGIGVTRAGVIETTFAEETETDLFGEQAVLCGGVSALVKAGFETLVEAGYQPEVAYFECLHELKLIVDLIYQGGLNYMRYSVSDTAEYGDYTGGPARRHRRDEGRDEEDARRNPAAASSPTAGSRRTRPAASGSRRPRQDGARRIRSKRSAPSCAR